MKKTRAEKSKTFMLEIRGDFMMNTTPVSKLSCERISYPYPTYSALVGIMNKIYYRPGIVWVIDECRIMNPIMYESIGLLSPAYFLARGKKRPRFNYSYLYNVKYQLKVHYELDYHRRDITFCNFGHDGAIQRAINNGPENLIYLGKTGCLAYVRPISDWEGKGYYDEETERAELFMFHSFRRVKVRGEYRDEVGFWNAVFQNGYINFKNADVDWRVGFDYNQRKKHVYKYCN